MIAIPDLINGLFEASGSLFILNNCRVLYRDKVTKGVSMLSTLYFVTWGLWNLFYYPHLGQWLSFTGGLAITISELTWLIMMVHYYNKNATKITL